MLNNRLFMYTIMLASLLLSKTTIADTLFTATYEGEYSNLDITLVRTLVSDGNQYRLDSTAKSFMAKIHESSKFSLLGNALRPQNYLYERKIFGVKKNESLSFDWSTLTATYKKGKTVEDKLKLMEGTLDPSLYQLQLQRDVAQALPADQFSYQFARRNQVKHYDFIRGPDTRFKLGQKEYKAITLIRQGDNKKETRIWLVPELDYTIAKIQHTEDDDTYQVLLTDYKSSAPLKRFLHSPVRP